MLECFIVLVALIVLLIILGIADGDIPSDIGRIF